MLRAVVSRAIALGGTDIFAKYNLAFPEYTNFRTASAKTKQNSFGQTKIILRIWPILLKDLDFLLWASSTLKLELGFMIGALNLLQS